MENETAISKAMDQHRTLEVEHRISDNDIDMLLDSIRKEISSAETKFPNFPINPNDMIAIIGEEFGEASQAAVDYMWDRYPTTNRLRGELAQCAAMCIRAIGLLTLMEREIIPSKFTKPEQFRDNSETSLEKLRLSLWRTPKNREYLVGIASHRATVKAPSPCAAAIFYGLHTSGNMQFGAVVYKIDGEGYDGESPWLNYSTLGTESVDDIPEDVIGVIKTQLSECEFIGEGENNGT